MKFPPASSLTNAGLRNSIENHEDKGQTQTPRYRELVEEDARRHGKKLDFDKSIQHLTDAAKLGRFTTYGALAAASEVPWSQARRLMDGANGHLDKLLSICHSRGIPLLTAICVNQEGVKTGDLNEGALAGFVNGAQRLGLSVIDGHAFLKDCQKQCFEWAQRTAS